MFQRMLIDRMENRILVGVTTFVGIMLLTGWVAINEGGRMAAFAQEYHARSVERGAAIFASTCAICHAPDARGTVTKAPALNNPSLFGFDPMADFRAELNELRTIQSPEVGGFAGLQAALADPKTTEARKAEITAQIEALRERYREQYGENLEEVIPIRLSELEAEFLARSQELSAAIAAGYDPEHPDRLVQLGWSAGLEEFVKGTITSGRPTSGSNWPEAMPAWGNLAGGPLRPDQVQDVTNYILNFDHEWVIEELNGVQQFAIVAGATTTVENPIGIDVAALLEQLAGVTGNPQRGQQLYMGDEPGPNGRRLGCNGCHLSGIVGPETDGTWARIVNERLFDPALVGYTPEQYVVESIVLPDNYSVPGFPGQMPEYFGEWLQIQDLADLLAYLQSLDMPTEE